MRKSLVFFDLDNTLIRGQSQIHFISYLYGRRIVGHPFYLRLLLWAITYRSGLVRDPRPIMEYAVDFLQGRNISEVSELVERFLDEKLAGLLFREAVAIIGKHRSEGRDIILISNAIEPIVGAVARRLNLRDALGTFLENKEGMYSGRLDGEITYGATKARRAREFAFAKGISLKDSLAYCDHISDLPLLELVQYPVAVNPDRRLRREAQRRNWPILVLRKC